MSQPGFELTLYPTLSLHLEPSSPSLFSNLDYKPIATGLGLNTIIAIV